MDVLVGFVIALIASIVTTLIYVGIVWRLDRYEKEPIRMLALAFAWGMAPAVILSVILEVALEAPVGAGVGGNLLADAGIAPIVEESAKAIVLLAFLVFAYREFDGILDGIVYGAMVGFGFAFTENLLYVVGGVAEDGLAVGMFILFLRTVIFGVNHAFFSSLAGAGVGAARMMRGVVPRLLVMSIGWLLAVGFHAIHNVGTALAEDTELASLAVSFVFDWGGVLMLFFVVMLVWRKEQRWMTEELAAEVEMGVLTADEYTAIRSSSGWQRLLTATLRQRGWTAYRRLGRHYRLFAELAFKKRQARLMGDEPGVKAEIARLRAVIVREKGAGGAA